MTILSEWVFDSSLMIMIEIKAAEGPGRVCSSGPFFFQSRWAAQPQLYGAYGTGEVYGAYGTGEAAAAVWLRMRMAHAVLPREDAFPAARNRTESG